MAAVGRKSATWGSRFAFIMAAVGSAVGLGNFWRFPYMAGENGGGAFILIYLGCVLLMGIPLLMAEYAMGRKAGMSAIEGVQSLARAEGKSLNWGALAWIGALAAFFILTFYMVISSWVLAFIPQAFTGAFAGFDAAKAGENFGATIGDEPQMILLLFLFIAANVIVVGRGVKGGLELAATVLMPLFFLMLIGIVIYAASQGDFAQAADFLLKPDFSEVQFSTFLAALGQAFFSLGVGVGLMITYGAYLPKDTGIPSSTLIVAGSDTLVSVIAGFAIFPLVFAFGLEPGGGPGLFFVTLPIAFGQMPGGDILGGAFFTLALFAAFTSSISLMEVGVSWLEERQGVTRWGASLGVGFVLFMIGAGYIYSTEFIDFVDFVTGSLMLPLGGLLVAIFAGWVLSREMLVSELGEGWVMAAWRTVIRWVTPALIGFILVFGTLDTMQNNGWIKLPGVLHPLLGPNPG